MPTFRKLSPHFHEKEFACPCCRRVEVSRKLVEALEELREKCGGKKILVHSGFRCSDYNAKIKGAPKSFHLKGMAADISVAGMTGEELGRKALEINSIRGIGVALYWAHVDVRDGNLVSWRYEEGMRKVYGPLS